MRLPSRLCRTSSAVSALSVLVLVGAGTAGCDAESSGAGGQGAGYDGPPLPWAYEPFPEVQAPLDNPQTPEKEALGLALFYDPILSRDDKTACVTCHSELWGMSDGVPLSVGVDGEGPVGPGRDGPNKTKRNSLTLWNAALRSDLFWDGRTSSLEEQALLPIENEVEMDLPLDQAVAKLAAVPAYVELFGAAFPGETPAVTRENLAKALSSFQRTLVTRRSIYDRYLAGDLGGLNEEAKAGMFLFGEAGCANCHKPPLFEAERYEARLPAASPAGPDDKGRAEFTGSAADNYAFRVPTLRNLRDTGPYFHDGRAKTLGEAVAIEVEIATSRGESRALSEIEIEHIAIFLDKALIDRSTEPARPRSVPSGLKIPADGNRIPR